MTKIILLDGVINVKESYDDIISFIRNSIWIELTEYNREAINRDKQMNIISDYKIYINTNHIQCIKK